MEAGQVESDGNVENEISYMPANPATPPAQAEHFGGRRFDPTSASSEKKRKVMADNHDSQEKNTPPSVSNCYVFKSRLQEYCQKAGLTTPVYETIKEGPSHEPSFRSTVIVNNVRYDSLPGFFNRKAAEQSAAEVALVELANSVDMKFGISQPVHETGLCKNLLQEYAQKMNYAIPLYECHKEEKQGRMPMYSCVVEIGGIKYVGAAASTKKEAEIKAARTALLAIQSAAAVSQDQTGTSVYTVIPQKKKVSDLGISTQETAAALKPKKGRFKNQQRKKRHVKRGNSFQGTSSLEVNTNGQAGEGPGVTDSVSSPNNMAGGFEVNIDERAGLEVNATDAIGSQVKTMDGSDIHNNGQSVTNIASSQGTDAGLTHGNEKEKTIIQEFVIEF
ncbi:UNVERIFIED_CONTAM: Double-stranded RNA-binding protein 1 [Sesamum radiatum]|uniref:Double-stranded RNA-binding protein 1 n=1 Tax=Sesamum radiatum TaxID=300843 RepID=A0AAW2W2X3_SESRA